MKPDNKKGAKDKDNKKEEPVKEEQKTPPLTPLAEIKANLALIERAVSTLEPRLTHRIFRTFAALRKRIDAKVLHSAVEEAYSKGEV